MHFPLIVGNYLVFTFMLCSSDVSCELSKILLDIKFKERRVFRPSQALVPPAEREKPAFQPPLFILFFSFAYHK